ncbi:MAG: hypothetical protein ACUVRD_01455 [Bacteroidia bacterium]
MEGLYVGIPRYGVNYTFSKVEENKAAEQDNTCVLDKFESKDYNLIGHRIL